MSASASSSSDIRIPLQRLADHANSYAAAHGLQVESRKKANSDAAAAETSAPPSSSSYQCAPISLLPNAFPRSAFRTAQSLAEPFNELVDRISRDGDFLDDTLAGGVAEADPYTGKLLELYNAIYRGKGEHGEDWGKFARLADRLGIQRSDYMLNKGRDGGEGYELKQVELNTIAASFAGLAVNVAGLHRHLTARFQDEVSDVLGANKRVVMGSGHVGTDGQEEGVPENPALMCIPRAMNVAHDQYKGRFLSDDAEADPVVLFVVQDGETNTVDQRMLEFNLWENHGVRVVRMSLFRAHTETELDEETGALYILPDEFSKKRREVSVVYFRAGYAPTDYPGGYDGIEWQAREKLERSRSSKCPCLGYHLAGTKKVQQELARVGTLERFFGEANETEKVASMRGAFAGLYSLGGDATEADISAVKDAMSGQEGQYVLKPQREGGGYNFYGDDLAKKLKDNIIETPPGLELGKELAEFILMERLFPPQQRAILLRAGLVEGSGDSISELGCFGTVVTSHDGNVLHNDYAGFLLRTKFSNVDEGGVASGFATLSSPYLC